MKQGYLLVDFNQIVISNLVAHLKQVTRDNEFSEDLVRHMVINTLRSNIKQFKTKYPNVVLCFDSKHYWRKDFFPFYKSHRKEDREASGFDWPLIFNTINEIKKDIKESFPYKVMDVYGAEADDIIAVLSARLSPHYPVLILSSDKDFGQLQKYPNIEQYGYSINEKKMVQIRVNNPSSFIKEHIIKGDRGDGIPNFLSKDSTFALKERQSRISTKNLNEWLRKDFTEFCNTDELLRGFKRNQTLIDFDYIPASIQKEITESFGDSVIGTKEKMLDYFISKDLKEMIKLIEDF